MWFMYCQKGSYEKYRNKNSEIRKFIYSKSTVEIPEELLSAIESINSSGSRLKSPFIAWFILPFLISLASFLLLIKLW
jgi:hypothetical protein